MSRARNIKPGFFKNELLVELAFEYRLLFVGLWTMADRDGRMEDRPTKIRMELFPADSVDVDAGLQALHEAGFVHRYEADGKRFIQVLAWVKHQNPHVKEAKSTIPAPDKHRASTGQDTTKADTSPADSLIPDSLIPVKPKQDQVAPPAAKPAAEHAPKATNGTRLPDDWKLSPEWAAWAKGKRPDLDAAEQGEKFADHWHAKPGKDGRKTDWLATWRNWIRNEKRAAPGTVAASAQPRTQGAKEALAPTESPLERSLAYTKQRYERGEFGTGTDAMNAYRAECQAQTQKHRSIQ